MEAYWTAVLMKDVKDGRLEGIKKALGKGAHVDGGAGAQKTPLHFSAQVGDTQLAKILCEKEANLDLKSQQEQGRTALHLASLAGHTDMVKLLLEEGADVTVLDNNSRSPLHLAAETGHKAVVEMLVQSNASVNLQDSTGLSPLHLAVDKCHETIVNYLLDHRANSGTVDNTGTSPLHIAAERGQLNILCLLVNHGVSVGAKDSQGRLAVHLAAFQGHQLILEELQRRGSNLDHQTTDGSTPLHLAAENNKLQVVRWLLQQGVAGTRKNCQQETPQDCAQRKGHRRVVNYLRQQRMDDGEQQTDLENSSERDVVEQNENTSQPVVPHLGPTTHDIIVDNQEPMTVHPLGQAELNNIRADDVTATQPEPMAGPPPAVCHDEPTTHIADVSVDNPEPVAAPTDTVGQTGPGNPPAGDDAGQPGVRIPVGGVPLPGLVSPAVPDDQLPPPHPAEGQDNTEGAPRPRTLTDGTDSEERLRPPPADTVRPTRADPPVANTGPPHPTIGTRQTEPTAAGLDNQGDHLYPRQSSSVHQLGSQCIKEGPLTPSANDTQYQDRTNTDHSTIRNGVTSNDTTSNDATSNDASTKLLCAASDGLTEEIEVLFRAGADVEVRSTNPDEQDLRPLHLACWGGHEDVVAILLHLGADPYSLGAGRQGVHWAAFGGHVPVLARLKEHGCDLSVPATDGSTPLHLAADNGNLEAVQWLVRHGGVDVHSKNKEGQTGKDLAAASHQKKVADYLRRKGNEELLLRAATSGMMGALVELLQKGVNVNATSNRDNHKGWSALHLAADSGHTSVVEALLQAGVQVDAQNAQGVMAVHLALQAGHLPIVQLLVSKSRPDDLLDVNGHHVIHWAAVGGHVQVLKYLYGKLYDLKTLTGTSLKSTLHLAADHGNLEAAKWLVQHGVSPFLKDSEGHTAHHYAAQEGHKDLAAFLDDLAIMHQAKLLEAASEGRVRAVKDSISFGVNLDCVSLKEKHHGRRPLHAAAAHGHLEVVQLLLQKGAQLEALDNLGNTAIHWAALGGNVKILNFLKLKGCSVASAVNSRSETPLHYAALYNHKDALKWLLSEGLDRHVRTKSGLTAEDMANRKSYYEAAEILHNFDAS